MIQVPKKNRNLDVVLFTPTLDGGVGRVTALLARGIHTRGIKIEVWTLNDGEYTSEIMEIVPVISLNKSNTVLSSLKLFKLLRQKKPKAIISSYFHTNCLAILLALLARTKSQIIITEHIALNSALKSLAPTKRLTMGLMIKLLYPRAHARVAVSKGVADEVVHCTGMLQKDISVIYNPVISRDLFTRSREPLSHPFFEKEHPVLVAAGRLMPEKDFPTLLAAFAQTNKKSPSYLIILGDGPDRGKLTQLSSELGIDKNVSFVGRVQNPYAYFLHADLFVLSSIREGLPTVLIEAMALGMKIVSTDCPNGPKEILEGGKYGKLVPMQDHEALAEAIMTSLIEPKTTIPSDTLKKYSIESATEAYLNVAKINEE